jgi:hypothetical protein
MQLKYFISTTLAAIIDGVVDAQEKVQPAKRANTGRIDPPVGEASNKKIR